MDAKLDALFLTQAWRVRQRLLHHQVDHRRAGGGIVPVAPPATAPSPRTGSRFLRGAASLVRSARLERHRELRGA